MDGAAKQRETAVERESARERVSAALSNNRFSGGFSMFGIDTIEAKTSESSTNFSPAIFGPVLRLSSLIPALDPRPSTGLPTRLPPPPSPSRAFDRAMATATQCPNESSC
eukprot:scaffold34752_cov72-Cyclotella_meneghiniana.AAC.1